MKQLLLYVLLVYTVNQSNAQPLVSPLRFTNYTIADGLPSNNVNDIMQDSHGFVWFSTSQGLARFDGSNFKVYTHSSKDSSGMPVDNINKCIELNNHELLFTCNTNLWMLNPANHKQHPPPVFWQKKGYTDFFILKKDLLAITIDGKIYFTNFNLDIIDSLKNPLTNLNQIIYLGNNNILFENFRQTFLYSLTGKNVMEWKLPNISHEQNIVYNFDDIDTLHKLLYIRGGGYNAVEMSYDKASPDYLKFKEILHTRLNGDGIIFCKKDVCIIPSDLGLSIQQPKRPEILVLNVPGNVNNLLPNNQHQVYTSSSGNYWITNDGGVGRFNLQQLNYQYWKLPYPAIINIYAKYDNKVWMSNGGYGSSYLDCASQTFHIIDSNIIRYCWGAEPVNNQIYIHGSSISFTHPLYDTKLFIYNPQTKKISNPSFLNPFTKDKELVTLVYQAKNGDIWYSINGGGGLVRQPAGTDKFVQYSESNTPSFHFRYANKAAEDDKGNIYFSVNKRSEILVWKNTAQHFEEWQANTLLQAKNIYFGPLWYHIIDSHQNLGFLMKQQVW